MSIIFKERSSDSPFVESITHGWTARDGYAIRPAEFCWHMVIVRHHGKQQLLVVGPWSTAGTATWVEGAEILWIKFKPGTFLLHLPPRKFRDSETILPGATSNSFYLNGSAWQFPDYENADTFLDNLARDDVLDRDPVVKAVLKGQPPNVSSRTVRHRFLRATGIPQITIQQMKRAQHAEALLRQGVSILDTVFEAGYYDQPHLTRSLKRYVGYTPAEIARVKPISE
jgi:hypothetical protein